MPGSPLISAYSTGLGLVEGSLAGVVLGSAERVETARRMAAFVAFLLKVTIFPYFRRLCLIVGAAAGRFRW